MGLFRRLGGRRRSGLSVEWRICHDEREWAELRWPEETAAAQARTRPAMRVLLAICPTLLLGMIVTGSSLYQSAQTGLATVEASIWAESQGQPALAAVLAAGGAEPALRPQAAQEARMVHALAQLESGKQPAAGMELVSLAGDVAVMPVVIRPAEGVSLRQTRVYRRTEEGWLHTTPSAAGRQPHRLEVDHLVIHYYELDEQTVREAAARLDELVPRLYAGLFIGSRLKEKPVIHVDPARLPSAQFAPASERGPFIVPSPSAYLAPLEQSDADVLAQVVLLTLLDGWLSQVQPVDGDNSHWKAVLDGVRLWQIWRSGLPMAAWREPLVRWVYHAPLSNGDTGGSKPITGPAPCAIHRLWLASPLQLQDLLLCDGQIVAERLVAWRELYPPPARLADLTLPASVADSSAPAKQPHPAASVALATILAYAADSYGAGRIPLVLASLEEHGTWETLVPAVFGVSAREFERGWQTSLADQLGAEQPSMVQAQPADR